MGGYLGNMGDWEAVIESEALAAHLRAQGYERPTAVQASALPYASKHRVDLIVASQTGTGKTLCFAIPIIERLAAPSGVLKALILTPTRELALQIEAHIAKVNLNSLTLLTLVGGIAREKQLRLLKRKPDIIIATPGRLWEFIHETKHPYLLELPKIEVLVIDEADRMVEAGHFRELDSLLNFIYSPSVVTAEDTHEVKHGQVIDLNCGQEIQLEAGDFYSKSGDLKDIFVKEIAAIAAPPKSQVPAKSNAKRQTFLLSATLTDSQPAQHSKKPVTSSLERLMGKIQFRGKPKIIDLTQGHRLPALLVERAVKCNADEKDSFLYYFLKERKEEKTIVFVNTIPVARKLVRLLKTLGFAAAHLDGKMRQGKRLKQLDRFKAAYTVLVATDVAGRGLDLPEVQNVVHYHLPRSPEIYIHRSGRTARIQHSGFSLAVIGPTDLQLFHTIQQALGEKIPKLEVDHRKWEECVQAVRVATELTGMENDAEMDRKTNAWERDAADQSDLILEHPTAAPKPNKRRKLALKDTLASLQAAENQVRASVISPELFRQAQARHLI